LIRRYRYLHGELQKGFSQKVGIVADVRNKCLQTAKQD